MHDNFSAPAASISGTIESDSPIDVYLSSLADFNNWASLNATVTTKSATVTATVTYVTVPNCNGPNHVIVAKPAITSYNFTLTLPSSGQYIAIFLNKSKTHTANVNVTVYSNSVAAYTSTSYSTIEQNILITETSLTPPTAQTSESNAGSTEFSPLIIGGIVAAVAIALLAVFLLRARRSKGPAVPMQPAKTQETTVSQAFCINCGRELHAGLKFCRYCGAEQP